MILDQQQYRADHRRLRAGQHEMEMHCLPLVEKLLTHSLEEQKSVNLADRTDSKFLLPVSVLPRFLQELNGDYTVLEDSGHRIFTYENTYFDTPEWDLYHHHHNGKLNRHKLRYRRYHETDIAYLEDKLKTNKNRTVKKRVAWETEDPAQVFEDKKTIQPSLYVNYRRISLWNHHSDERLTLDYDLHYCRPQQDSIARLEHLFIAELKRDGNADDSSFVRRARDYGFTPQPFSKYCVGACLTDDGSLKRNQFKSILNTVNQIQLTGTATV